MRAHCLASRAALTAYSGALTAVFLVIMLGGMAPRRPTTFDEINVHRINVLEPDGTLRLVISSHARLPGIIVKGHETAFACPQAGMLFYNDEASEVGGLIFGGRRNRAGAIENAGGSLSFDRYAGNQEVQLLGVHDSEDRLAGLVISDSPPDSAGHRRVWVGRDDSGAASIALMDASGRKRVLIEAPAIGVPRLVFFDTAGRVVRAAAADSR